ncbi:MAG: PD-(D/E)XK nuclease family protein [Bacteroidetes bacterium]|nr:PD-(D/E)XK nuclease family protein [Bacteroidota bacterium]
MFSIPNDASSIYGYLNGILNWFADKESESAGGVFGNKNLMQHVHNSFSEFVNEVKTDTQNFDEISIWQLLNDFFSKFKFPFSGEPVLGLQLMGFLETRVLDFKTVIITNVNEGVLPSDSFRNSFIPFSIRKSFKLPTFLNQDAIFAYHFYRLLQRAENIFLIYNTEVNSSSGGEMSRYILQIVYELRQKFPTTILLKHKLATQGISIFSDNAIVVNRNKVLTEKLVELFARQEDGGSLKRFSPSSINSFVYCPFKFYLHYVQGLREDETVEESMQANEFGNVFHKTLEQLYLPFLNAEINTDTTKKLIPEIGSAVSSAIKQEYDKSYVSEGENYLFEKVLEELVAKTINQDEAYAPFKLIALETEYSQWVDLGNKTVVKLFESLTALTKRME